jgi:hypothetical protein
VIDRRGRCGDDRSCRRDEKTSKSAHVNGKEKERG